MPKQTPRYKGDLEPVPAYSEAEVADLQKLKLASEAFQIWKADLVTSGGDRGTCIIGAGIAVWYRKPRARYATSRVLVGPPGQSDCSWCRDAATRYLEEHGVVGLHFEYGMMD